MDPVLNPFSPGAGTPPPELSGRDELRAAARIALERTIAGRPVRGILLIGLRGVGKTVLLDRIRGDALSLNMETIRAEAPEGRSLPALLAPQLRSALLRISRIENAKDKARRALRALAGFVTALKVKYDDIEVGLDYEPEAGLADNGDLEQDLQTLMELVGEAAKSADTSLGIFIDELQYIEEPELASFVMALHRTSQRQLPVIMIGAGLPQLPGKLGRAKSYAERLFQFSTVGPLDDSAARSALSIPVEDLGAEFESSALDEIVAQTQGYPYFIQEWGKHCWDVAEESPIGLEDVMEATPLVMAALDDSFFRVRFDRLTPSERRYLRAMAELGPGPHRSGDVADVLNRKVTALGPVRSQLIAKGMVWSPGHGDTAFSVPLFDAFMRRVMPDLES